MLPGGEPPLAGKMTIRHTTPFGLRTRLREEFEARTGSIADQLGDMISAHAPDGTYLYVSAASRELLGYEPDELIGVSAYALFHPDDAPKVAVAHRSTLEGTPFTVAYRLRRKDNEYLWVETTTRVIADEESGEAVEIVCSTRPVGDRRVVERLASEEHRQSLERVQTVLDEEQINPVYQPILELETGEVIAYEALSRFPADPERGPDRWFAEAWDIGLGIPLELLAVQIAARALPQIPDDVSLSVNASPPTVISGRFLSCFDDSADRVTVELTEHLNVDDYEGFTSKLQPLRAAGGRVAIDDFGAGYASLRHIIKVRPEWIKLDISLTERIDENPLVHALAKSLVSFADEVGVRVIAEGIETEEELEALIDAGFRYGQGFYFGVPAPLEEALSQFS
jgi:PAS domain S-box-containing protein